MRAPPRAPRALDDAPPRGDRRIVPRRSGRAVEGSGFENRRTFTGTQGSNPCSSAESSDKLGLASDLLKAAGSIFGGSINNAAYGADHVNDALRGTAWDSAFNEAIAEMRPKFRQCTRCGRWVCPEVCWNEARRLCEECALDLHEEAAAIQARVAVEQMEERAHASDQTGGIDLSQAQHAACPHCSARIEGSARFCASCGKTIADAAATFCSQCGARCPRRRFCGGCGTPAAG